MKGLRLALGCTFVLAVVGSAACLQATQIELTLRTDVPYQPGRTVAITVAKGTITDATAPSTTAEDAWQADGKIGTLVLLPSDQRDEPVSVRAVLGLGRDPSTCTLTDAKGCIFARRKLAFVAHEPLALPITLYAACEGVPCDESSTCTALGTCVPADVDPAACADGNTCDVPAGEPVTSDASGSSSSSSSSSGGASADDGGFSSSSSSGGSSGVLDAGPDAASSCDPTDVTVAASDFFSFGTVVNQASIQNGDPFFITIDQPGALATFERTVPTPNPACALHFAMDVRALTIDTVGTSVGLMTVKRPGFGDLVLEAYKPQDSDTMQLSFKGTNEVYLWPAPQVGSVAIVIPLFNDGFTLPGRLVVNGVSTRIPEIVPPLNALTSVAIQFGLTGAFGKVGYHSARYHFAP